MGQLKINRIIEVYRKTFPYGWYNDDNWSDENSCKELYVKLNAKLQEFEQEAFFLIAQSIMSGEYLVKPNVQDTLISISDCFTDGEIFDDKMPPLLSKLIFDFNNLVGDLIRVIRRYRYLLTWLNEKYEDRRPQYVLNALRTDNDRAFNCKFSKLYNILLDVTSFDHFLSTDKNKIQNLILDYSELEKAVQDPAFQEKNILAIKVLKEKCMFILKKLMIDDNKEFDFMIDFERKHYDTSTLTFSFFSEMNNLFEFYRTDTYTNDSIGKDLDIKAAKKGLGIGQYALLMKYYKDSKNTQEIQIDNILNDFDTSYNALSKQFTKRPLDVYALGTLKNYMYNSRFSYRMSKKNDTYSFEKLRVDLNDIINIQNQTGVLNFYPYRKAFEKSKEMLHNNEMLSKNEMLEYKRFMSLCIEKFAESIKWCETYSFYPIQNVYNECLTTVKEYDFGAVYVASSFCRPIRYEKLRDELDSFKNFVLLIDNEIALKEEKEELTKLRKDIDNTRTKEIEILSFFTAIITFLFGSIGFFAKNENNDFIHLFYSILGLGAILLIFVSGIHITTMRIENKWHPRAWFCYITMLVCIILIFYLIYKCSYAVV